MPSTPNCASWPAPARRQPSPPGARRSGVPLIELRLWVPLGTDQPATAELLAAALPGAAAERDRAGFDAALAAGGSSVRITVDPQRLLLSATAPAASLTTLLALVGDCLTGARYRPPDLDQAPQPPIPR